MDYLSYISFGFMIIAFIVYVINVIKLISRHVSNDPIINKEDGSFLLNHEKRQMRIATAMFIAGILLFLLLAFLINT